jgi:predicted ester cyclase
LGWALPKPFVGPEQTAEQYRFPDFTVRARRVLCADENCVVTENQWRGTHLGTFLGRPATGKPVRMRAIRDLAF